MPGDRPRAAAKKTTAKHGGERSLDAAERRGRRAVHDPSEGGETAGGADEEPDQAEVEDDPVRARALGGDGGREYESGRDDDAGQDEHGRTDFVGVAGLPALRYPRPNRRKEDG